MQLELPLHSMWLRHKDLHSSKTSLFWKTIQTDLLSYQLNITISGKLTKTNKHASGLLKRSILVRIPKIGHHWTKMNNISSSMFLPSLQQVMVSFLRTLLRDSWLRYRFQRQEPSTVSKWWWKTFILRPMLSWLIHTSKTIRKKITSSRQLKTSHLLPKRPNGL